MMYNEDTQVCVCEGNAIAVTGGCRACADDEIASGGKCACPVGQAKGADNLCVTVQGLGFPCDTQSAPCTDPVYSYCAADDGGTSGRCTRACATSTDCDDTYTCATWEAQPYCRTFEGAGASCSGPSDCTGDARYCDTFMTHQCLVQGCSLTLNDCPRGTMCCNFARFGLGTLCAGGCP